MSEHCPRSSSVSLGKLVDDLVFIVRLVPPICENGNAQAIAKVEQALQEAKQKIWGALQENHQPESLELLLIMARSNNNMEQVAQPPQSRREMRDQILAACHFRSNKRQEKQSLVEQLIENMCTRETMTLAQAIKLHGDEPEEISHERRMRKFLTDIGQRIARAGLPYSVSVHTDSVALESNVSIPKK